MPTWLSRIDCRSSVVLKTLASPYLLVSVVCLFGFESSAFAQSFDPSNPASVEATRIWAAYQKIMTMIEGPFGALVMSCAGIGAILSAAFGQYRAALSCMVVAIGSFILRNLVHTFIVVPANISDPAGF